MADEKRQRRKSAAARPDYRSFLAGTTPPPAEPIEEEPTQELQSASAAPQLDITDERTPLPKATRIADPEPGYERKRFRTTIFLPPDLEELVDRMKIDAKRKGRRETLQFYVEEGLRLLAHERGITLD